jgi:ribosomal protein L37E
MTGERDKHLHTVVKLHALSRRAGVPYQVERTVCSACGRVLAEQTVKRAAA